MKTKQQFPVLLIEDDVVIAETYKAYLEDEPIQLVHVNTGNTALTHLQQTIPKAILLDLGLPDMNGIEIIKHVKQHRLNCTIIVLTAKNAVEVVVEAMRYRIFDFLEKPVQANRLIATLRQALSAHSAQQSRSPRSINIHSPPEQIQQYHQFIGASPPMQDIYHTIVQIANGNATVLITGETGTGKELCADAIHQESTRRRKPFIIFNCAAIPHHLMESELFGYVKGAYTGAETARAGAALTANGGTLFLDEIGEMDLELQKKLLRFVETKSFNQVGSDKKETVDIRFIFATNRHLHTEVKAGRFREDLYYRLKTIAIPLPPLRDRGDDVLLLAQKFLDEYNLQAVKNFQGFGIRAERLLLHYKWPGNVRQLNGCIQSIVLMNDGNIVTSEMLIATLGDDFCYECTDTTTSTPQPVKPQLPAIAITSRPTIRPLWQVEKEVIEEAIEYCGGNTTRAAELLEISRATIYNKLKKWRNQS